jgi:hypothetical protein
MQNKTRMKPGQLVPAAITVQKESARKKVYEANFTENKEVKLDNLGSPPRHEPKPNPTRTQISGPSQEYLFAANSFRILNETIFGFAPGEIEPNTAKPNPNTSNCTSSRKGTNYA